MICIDMAYIKIIIDHQDQEIIKLHMACFSYAFCD